MITVTMVKKLKDNNGKIYGYIIRDGYGKEAGIYTNNLKEHIRNGVCEVTNMTLTSDNRLIDKKYVKDAIALKNPIPIVNKEKQYNEKLIPSIFGVQIKSIKTGHGRDGEYYYGTVYYLGRKLGMWSQDSRGCIVDNYEFNEHILDDALNSYRMYMNDTKISMETLMSHVVILSEYYKSYEKMIKQGKYSKLTIVTDTYDIQYIEIKHNGINAAISNSIDVASHKISKNGFGVVVKHFNSRDDFAIG